MYCYIAICKHTTCDYYVVMLSAETQDEIKEKTAFEDLEQSFKTLTSHKIKDKLSAFLPDIPGMYYHGD